MACCGTRWQVHWLCVRVLAPRAPRLPMVGRSVGLRASAAPPARRGSRTLFAALRRTGCKGLLQCLRRHHGAKRSQRRAAPRRRLPAHRYIQRRRPQVWTVARCRVVSPNPPRFTTVGVASMSQRPNPSIERTSSSVLRTLPVAAHVKLQGLPHLSSKSWP